jgi:hypothetical protein
MLIQCPEQYRLRHIQKIREGMGPDKFIGIVDHAAHAENFRQKIRTSEDLDVEYMRGLYRAKWTQTIENEGDPEIEKEEEMQATGLLMMETYHENASPTIAPIKVEERFEEKLPGLPVPIVGYPDVETKDRIVERKTSKTRLTKPKSKWQLQGRIYSMVFDKPVEYHVITKQKQPQLVTPEAAPDLLLSTGFRDATLETLEQAVHTLNDLWARYGPDRPWPTNGVLHDWLCGYCFAGPKYGNHCVAWKENE